MLPKYTLRLVMLVLCAVLISGCIPSASSTPTPQPTAVQAITPSPLPTLIPTGTLTPSPIPVATQTLVPSPTPEQTPIAEGPLLVLWDLSHGPRQSESGVLYEPDRDGLYSQLKSLLEEQDITLVANRDPLEQVDLSKYAMAVIAMTSTEKQNYTSAEAEIIGQFVNQGGNLLVLAENPDFPNRILQVISYYNIDLGKEKISKAVTSLEDHPIFKNIDEVYFEFDGGSLNVRNSQARIVASQNGKVAIVVIEGLPGRVVIVGDSNLFDNRGLWRNKQFAINLFQWLTQRSD